MTADRDRRAPLLGAELGLLAVALGTVATFTRLFQGSGFLAALIVPLVASWATAVALRRLRVGAGWSTLASFVLGVLVLTWWFVPDSTNHGLPTGRTITAVADAVSGSFGGFADQVAPVPASDGFMLAIAALVWVFVLFADTSAIRYRAPVQAILPLGAMVVASGVLARDAGRVGAAVAFAAGLAVYAVTQQIWRASTDPWRPGDTGAGIRAVAGSTATVAAVVLAAGVLVAPLLPGDQQAVVDLRSLGRGEGPRTVVSPFVGVTSLLGERSDELMFTVTAPAPTYWRLTALEQYDPGRAIWTSRGTYRSTDAALRAPGEGASSLVQEYELAGLGGLWLPAAFEAVAVEGQIPVGFDESSSSLIARDDANVPGTAYRVRSAVRGVTAAPTEDLTTDPDPVGDAPSSPSVADTARRIVGDETDPFRQAVLLQDWLRGPGSTYDTTVDYRGEPDPAAAFLATRRGFCQQFASAHALLARSLGIPSRVAVGFTPGDPLPDRPDRYEVRGRHAHAWPEVELPGLGWVSFEPTPGRGDPGTAAYTGVAADQAEPPPESQSGSTTTVPTTTAVSPATTTPAFDASGDAPRAAGDGPASDDPGAGRALPLLLAAGLVGLTATVTLLFRLQRRRWRRRRDLTDPDLGPVAVAWSRATDAVRLLGRPIRIDETPLEFAARISDEVGGAPPTDGVQVDRSALDADLSGLAADLSTLARIETFRRYGPTTPDAETIELSVQLADHVHAAAVEQLTRRRRLAELVR